MQLQLVPHCDCGDRLALLIAELQTLGVAADIGSDAGSGVLRIDVVPERRNQSEHELVCSDLPTMLEQTLAILPFEFDHLPLLYEGESKIVRLLSEQLTVQRFKPTVYSYTYNRYGIAEGTESVRMRFSAEVFRRLNREFLARGAALPSAFLGISETTAGPLIFQRRVTPCNLEVRVKRYHIGSPLHRYRYTEQYPTTQSSGPLRRWSRFDRPIVCFDWRHPLRDETGQHLADEPISDDYAAVWMEHVPHAKELARTTFVWLEDLMRSANLVLVDICFFIDRSGQLLFGEISPDCMRVREYSSDPDYAQSFDKDLWRSGAAGAELYERYAALYRRLFG